MNKIYFHTTYITIGGCLFDIVRVFTIKEDLENLYIQKINSSKKIIKYSINGLSHKEIENI